MSPDKHSKTERASAQKRQKSREKGQVFRSSEVSAALGFIAAVTALAWLGGALHEALATAMVFFLSNSAVTTTAPDDLVADALYRASRAGVPLMAITLCFSLAGTVAQSLPVLTFDPITPDVKRLFSLKQLTNMFSLSGLAKLSRGVVGLVALTVAGVSVLAPELGTLSVLPDLAVPALGAWVSDLVFQLLVRAAVIFVFIGVVDYALNHRQHEDEMKMTKQEVKEEHKQYEGDPRIKARIRRLQRAAAQRRMMSMVEKATVVITNPTHVAVALLYDAATSPAPRVVAKGKGDLAERIRTRARKHGVVIYEDPPLARALHSIEVGSVIPAELYKAVAEVLAHLVRLSGTRL